MAVVRLPLDILGAGMERGEDDSESGQMDEKAIQLESPIAGFRRTSFTNASVVPNETMATFTQFHALLAAKTQSIWSHADVWVISVRRNVQQLTPS
jgi:hypothetical protein